MGACVGLVLLVWSTLVIGGVQVVTIGEYKPWLAWGGLVLGALLLGYSIWGSLGER